MNEQQTNGHEANNVINFLARERQMVLSFKEFRHRVRGYGYCIRRDDEGHYVAALPHFERICQLPEELRG